MAGITKRFPGVVANDAIDLALHRGEIHVLLGENGAGKSTLIAILAGLQQPDAGTIRISGETVRLDSPRASLARGIGVVFQHLQLVPSLSVIENLMLGHGLVGRLDRAPALKRLAELQALLGVTVDADAPVGKLSLGQQQQVEIIRALWRDAKVLILDEPTSMLTPKGVEDLGEVMRRLRAAGTAIVFVTHKMREAYQLGDRITVLRQGRVVGGIDPQTLAGLDEAQATDRIISLIFDRADTATGFAARGRTVDRSGSAILSLRGISTSAGPGECALGGIDLDLWPGEVLGIAGVDGNGQKHLAEVLSGQRRSVSGTIRVNGQDVTDFGVPDRRTVGIAYITDERLGEGTVGAFSVAINLVLKEIGSAPLWRRGLTRWPALFGQARERIAQHDVRTPSERTPIAKLSGGNIQKVLLARELTDDARVVVFNKPTYGLDLHNTILARSRIVEAADRGIAAIVISTELDELAEVSDRIAVLAQGRLAGIVDGGADADRRIGRLMTGAAH